MAVLKELSSWRELLPVASLRVARIFSVSQKPVLWKKKFATMSKINVGLYESFWISEFLQQFMHS